MKKLFLCSVALCAMAFAVTSCDPKGKANQAVAEGDSIAVDSTFNFEGDFKTADTDSLGQGYWQAIKITKADSGYAVSFTASKLKGEPGCSFEGKGQVKNDTLMINIGDKGEDVWMTIAPNAAKTGVEVATKNEDNMMKLQYYCKGGGSLAGEYLRQEAK